MDFLSLFDPSDGNQSRPQKKRHRTPDNVKKKPDSTGKGRRRGRKSNGKNETLPEESSFLCEPDLSTEILVKEGSYIDSYIELNNKEGDQKTDDKKPKRRNSGRKSRRRKKYSPFKDIAGEPQNNLNNLSSKPKLSDGNIGKNVNDLSTDNLTVDSSSIDKNKDDFKKNKRKDEFKDVYNSIDKFEKVILKDDMFLAGDFYTENLEGECFYCSDDNEEFGDDSSSEEGSESGDEVYGSLPPEPRFGNVEYKLRLSTYCEKRFQHLVTQLKWRLGSGGGGCVYVLGVRDCGALVGLRARALRRSLAALRRMAAVLGAALVAVRARRLAPRRAVAEVQLRLADPQQSIELRIAVMGANEAGKSTLIGVLTQGELDNGTGSARLNMFRHQHEVKTGRTSSLSHEILGFDAQGNVVNYGCSSLMTAARIGERSAKLVAFLDLAGHYKYQRTTRHGLTGYSPHAAMLVISATAGITPITEEHISILLALKLTFFVVISKCELAPNAPKALLVALRDILRPHCKKPVLINDEHMARECCSPPQLILDSVAELNEGSSNTDGDDVLGTVPVFPVSCVRGCGLNALHAYLLALQPPTVVQPEHESCEFQIDEIFHVGESSGPVVGGLLTRGQLAEGDTLLIGPLESGSFRAVCVRSIYRNRVPHGCARAGQPASLGLAQPCPPVRPGMVLLAIPEGYRQGARPSWGGCAPGHCRRRNELPQSSQPKQQLSPKSRKHSRRKNKNLLANVEEELTKDMDSAKCNIYRSDSEDEPREVDDCVCEDKVLLEDPRDPRGCIFFQASVQVLRHSTAIYPGFQCTIHVGNVRQTAIIEGIMSRNNLLRAGESASVLFRFVRCPEYLTKGRQLLFMAGLGTRGTGRITQIFPYVP